MSQADIRERLDRIGRRLNAASKAYGGYWQLFEAALETGTEERIKAARLAVSAAHDAMCDLVVTLRRLRFEFEGYDPDLRHKL